MNKTLSLCFFLFFFLAYTVNAERSLPPGVRPYAVEGEAKGSFPELLGSGTITFINTGGEARLTTVCDQQKVENATCSGVDVAGTFSGGPNGTAVFKTQGGDISLKLNDGKVFSFRAGTISMDFTVTDPSIFDAWVEGTGARDSGARVSDLSGQVEIACPPDLEAWDVMKMGRIIYVDCHLKTGEDSKAVISLPDMTTFELKAESEIVIDTPPEKDSKWKLIMGNIWVNVKKMIKNGTMEVHMSQAVAGIKGTTFILEETKDASSIKVIEGKVDFESRADGRSAIISTGEKITADRKGLGKKTSFDVTAESKSWGKTPEKKADAPPGANTIYLAGGIIAAIAAFGVILKTFYRKNAAK